MHKLKFVKLLALVFVAFSLIFVTSCGKDDGGGKTDKELVIEALTTSTWTVDATATSVSNVNGEFDVSTFTISFSETTDGVSFDLGGDLETYLSDGTFTVTENGGLTEATITTASTDLEASVSSISLDTERTVFSATIQVNEAGNSRVVGIGTYELIFAAGS